MRPNNPANLLQSAGSAQLTLKIPKNGKTATFGTDIGGVFLKWLFKRLWRDSEHLSPSMQGRNGEIFAERL